MKTKFNSIPTEDLINQAIELIQELSQEAEKLFEMIIETLEKRLSESEFVILMNNLYLYH